MGLGWGVTAGLGFWYWMEAERNELSFPIDSFVTLDPFASGSCVFFGERFLCSWVLYLVFHFHLQLSGSSGEGLDGEGLKKILYRR